MVCRHFACTAFIFSIYDECNISLAGTWRFKTDPQDVGVQEKWFNKTLDETIKLPGSTAENGKGDDINLKTKWTGSITIVPGITTRTWPNTDELKPKPTQKKLT